jgi:hypothetical protein
MHGEERRRGSCGLMVAMGPHLPPQQVICSQLMATYILA